MSILTGSVEDLITPQLIDRLSEKSGVPPARVRTGMNGAVASILDGLATKAHDPRAMSQVADLVQTTGPSGEPLENDAIRGSSSQLLGVVGGDSRGFVTRLAGYAGVGAAAAAGFVGAAAAVVLGAFRRLGGPRGGLDASTLSSTLIEEQPELHAAVPARLLEPATGVEVERTGYAEAPRVRRAAADAIVEAETTRGSWLLPVLLLAGLVALIALWVGRRHDAPMSSATPNAPTAQAPGTMLVFPAGTPEAVLVGELKSPPPNPAWIDLDARFDIGKATLLPRSNGQLADIAQALAAFPQARVRIAGYADNDATTAANTSLSWARADAIRDQLIKLGVEPSRLEVRAYGQVVTRSDRRAAIQVIR